MPKAYMVTTYRSIKKPEALAAYAKLATSAMHAAGGRFLVRGVPSKVYELGMKERTTVIEFESLAKALAAYESVAYKDALRALGENAVERDMRLVEGID
jgi:uncharacterized protein (DUF1330 family)